MEILTAIAQAIALLAACCVLFLMWRRFLRERRLVLMLVSAGFLIRAIPGALLFWISWRHLPIARSMQLGDGFWWYASDGWGYYKAAIDFASAGIRGIAAVPGVLPSPVYVRLFAVCVWLFGTVSSIAVLLNCFCYLAMAAVMTALGRRDARLYVPSLFAIACLSFAPGALLWSLQPLKDTFNVCLITLFIGACVVWQDLWTGDPKPAMKWRAAGLAAAMFALIYAISGVRWYLGLALWISVGVFSLFMFTAGRRRLAAGIAAFAVCVFLTGAVLIGAPENLATARAVMQQDSRSYSPVRKVLDVINRTRSGFDRTTGATAIMAGRLFASPKTPAATVPARHPQVAMIAPHAALPPPQPAAKAAHNHAPLVKKHPAAPVRAVSAPPVQMASAAPAATPPSPPPAKREPAVVSKPAAVSTPVTTPPASVPAQAITSAVPPPPPSKATGTAAEAVAPAAVPATRPSTPETTSAETPKTASAAPAAAPPSATPHSQKAAKRRELQAVPPPPTAEEIRHEFEKSRLTPQVRTPQDKAAGQEQVSRLPKSAAKRFVLGLAATFVPNVIGEKLGLVDIQGGKGPAMWLIVDTDTLFLDVLAIFVAWWFIRNLRRQTFAPVLAVALVSFAILAPTMIYTVSNFGTLFRLREMLFIQISLLPLATMIQRPTEPAVEAGPLRSG